MMAATSRMKPDRWQIDRWRKPAPSWEKPMPGMLLEFAGF